MSWELLRRCPVIDWLRHPWKASRENMTIYLFSYQVKYKMKGLSTQGAVANCIMSTVDYHRKLTVDWHVNFSTNREKWINGRVNNLSKQSWITALNYWLSHTCCSNCLVKAACIPFLWASYKWQTWPHNEKRRGTLP